MNDYRSLLHPKQANVAEEAGFLRRAFAFLADLLIIDLFLAAPFLPVLSDLVGRVQHEGTVLQYTGSELAAIVLLCTIAYLYFVLFEYTLGQTPGMMLAQTRVEGDGLGRMLLRNSLLLPVFPFIAFWIIEPLAIVWARRGVLEYLSSTRTIHQRTLNL